ncbi:hypothetical protein D3C80_1678310 [compost metagenome]
MALLVLPAVEADVGDGQISVGVLDEGRPAVAAPQVVRGNVPELDRRAEPRAIQPPRSGRRHHGHRLMFADRIGDAYDIGLDRGQIVRAIDVHADRPLHQGPSVSGAFERHFIALRRGVRRGAPGCGGSHGGEASLDQAASVHAARN